MVRTRCDPSAADAKNLALGSAITDYGAISAGNIQVRDTQPGVVQTIATLEANTRATTVSFPVKQANQK
ncbi:MAG: hypothetical protein EPN40_05275 [Rhodanobacteraceae bacterium]|nr:MAG: hypothetical protein EPN40_05275 [Rhodanobacteraceae bacterium]